MELSRVQAVLLDMDGTLVDSDAAVERSWLTWASEYPVDTRQRPAGRARAARGGQRPAAPAGPVRGRGRGRGPAPAGAGVRRRRRRDRGPGRAELLGELDRLGLPWAVVTSADSRWPGSGWPRPGSGPALLVTSEDVRAGKPDPEGYLLAARKLGADPRRCLVVEDAEAGVRAGRAAGATVAALKGVPADIQIADLYELSTLLLQACVTPRT